MERLGFRIPTLGAIDQRQAVEARGHVGVLGPQGLLVDRQRPLVERLRLAVLTLGAIEPRQVVEAGGHAGMFRPQRLLPDRQRPLE